MKLLNKESEFNKLLDDTFNKPLSDYRIRLIWNTRIVKIINNC